MNDSFLKFKTKATTITFRHLRPENLDTAKEEAIKQLEVLRNTQNKPQQPATEANKLPRSGE